MILLIVVLRKYLVEILVACQYPKEDIFVLLRVEVEVEQDLLLAELAVAFQLSFVQLKTYEVFIRPGFTVVVV